jgi:hypothetical protein
MTGRSGSNSGVLLPGTLVISGGVQGAAEASRTSGRLARILIRLLQAPSSDHQAIELERLGDSGVVMPESHRRVVVAVHESRSAADGWREACLPL